MEVKGNCRMVALLWISLGISFMGLSVQAQGGLQAGFYSSTCPMAEFTVRSTVEKYFNTESTVPPGLLRLHFQDCFVEGYDTSILISGASAERSAVQNFELRGFEVVNDAKSQVEALCPGVVSCADILALAACDAVHLTGGPSWLVPLGRKNSRISSASEAANLPSLFDSVSIQRQKFAGKGLTDHDLVTLVGAHNIGQTNCLFFRYQLYNFTTTTNSDTTINQSFVGQLQAPCPRNGNASKWVA